MSLGEYYWDEKIEYLMRTRNLYYNDDYLQFLVKSVWKISKPVRILDFGCGYGYLGLKLMPLLPEGSSYTGVDLGEKLLQKGRELFQSLSYKAEFVQCDANEYKPESAFDISICHALLLHMSDPITTLRNMIACTAHLGRIICFEPHWIANMASFQLLETAQSSIVQLGALQRLFEQDAQQYGKDGNIGIKLPTYLSQLGVQQIDCRISDKVVFLDPNMERNEKEELYQSLLEDGIGAPPRDREAFLNGLVSRGMGLEEAEKQYQAELNLSRFFSLDSAFTAAADMKITTGIVYR